jgi:ureidoacrylate peracid hydrolase
VASQPRTTIRFDARYWRAFPPESPLGHASETLELAIDETAFLLVDVYGKRFEADDAESALPADLPAFYRPPPEDPFRRVVHERIVPARAAARSAGLRVLYVANHLTPGLSEGSEWRNMSLRTCGVDVLTAWREPTPILEHAAIIAPGPDEPLIRKQHYSGFFGTTLDSVLRGYGTRTLVVVGFDSRICLAATVTDAMQHDYRVVVLRDAIRTTEYPDTEADAWANTLAERYIESNIGYTATSDDFIAACEDAARARRQP